MNNDLFITFDKNSYNLKKIKEEEHSRATNPSIEDEINYLNELKQLIEIKVKEINQEMKNFQIKYNYVNNEYDEIVRHLKFQLINLRNMKELLKNRRYYKLVMEEEK